MALTDSFVKKEFSAADELEQMRKEALLEEMGITTNDVEKLRAMMLNSSEAVCAKREEMERIRQHKGRKEYWDEFIDAKRRMGRVMHHSDVIYRLRKMLPEVLVVPGGQAGCIGVYVVKNVPTNEFEGYRGNRKRIDYPLYISWLPVGEMPEYEIDIVNDVDVAVAQKRGWRTVLLRLIVRKDFMGRPMPLITERQAEENFGYPTNGPTGSWYRMALYRFRNG